MLTVALLAGDPTLEKSLRALPFWGEDAELTVLPGKVPLKSLPESVGSALYDLLLVDVVFLSEETWRLLDKVHLEKGLPLALVSRKGDFEVARQGILHGVVDYLTEPFDGSALGPLMEKLRVPRLLQRKDLPLGDLSEELKRLFYTGSEDCVDLAALLLREGKFSRVADESVKAIFDESEWLDLYVKEESFLSDEADTQNTHYEQFFELFDLWHALHPDHNENLESLFQYVLFNPESDLRQKNLSTELHINQSYLSTVFVNQTGIRFVDYITRVKMARAAWLLLHTNLKVSEVARRIDYKDTAYFSKQFKTIYLMTPSEYRVPDTYRLWI